MRIKRKIKSNIFFFKKNDLKTLKNPLIFIKEFK